MRPPIGIASLTIMVLLAAVCCDAAGQLGIEHLTWQESRNTKHASMVAFQAASGECSLMAALVLARAYILAQPILITDDMYLNNGQPLRQFVAEYRDFFIEGGESIRCAALAGPRLAARGMQLYDPNAYENVMAASPPEVAHLAPGVADRINGGSYNMIELGMELIWLSQVLPAVALGDLGPFHNTGYDIRNLKRQQIEAIWPSMQLVCAIDKEQCRMAFDLALPMMRQAFDEFAFVMAYVMVQIAADSY